MVCTIVLKLNMILTNIEKRSPPLFPIQHRYDSNSPSALQGSFCAASIYVIVDPFVIAEKNLLFFYCKYVVVGF